MGATLDQIIKMSQKGNWETTKVSENNQPYTATATAKRFSSTAVASHFRTVGGGFTHSDSSMVNDARPGALAA
jgi:hypothetical protein